MHSWVWFGDSRSSTIQTKSDGMKNVNASFCNYLNIPLNKTIEHQSIETCEIDDVWCLVSAVKQNANLEKKTRTGNKYVWHHCWCAERTKSPPTSSTPPPPSPPPTATTININCMWFVLSNNHCCGLDRPRDEINYRLPQVAIEHAWVSLNSIIHVINPQCNFVANTKTKQHPWTTITTERVGEKERKKRTWAKCD